MKHFFIFCTFLMAQSFAMAETAPAVQGTPTCFAHVRKGRICDGVFGFSIPGQKDAEFCIPVNFVVANSPGIVAGCNQVKSAAKELEMASVCAVDWMTVAAAIEISAPQYKGCAESIRAGQH